MDGLLPIIRRVRRPLLPPDERAASVPLAVPATVPVLVLEVAPAPAPPIKPEPALKRVARSPQREPEKSNV